MQTQSRRRRTYTRIESIYPSPRREATATRGRSETGWSTRRATEARRSKSSRRETWWRETGRSSTASESRATNTSCRTLQSNTSASACRPADACASRHSHGDACCSRRTGSESCARVCGRRSIEGAGYHVGSTDNGQAQGALLFGLDGLLGTASRGTCLGLTLHSAELLSIGEYEVHVLCCVSRSACSVYSRRGSAPCRRPTSGQRAVFRLSWLRASCG
jgi:hypothetical protein